MENKKVYVHEAHSGNTINEVAKAIILMKKRFNDIPQNGMIMTFNDNNYVVSVHIEMPNGTWYGNIISDANDRCSSYAYCNEYDHITQSLLDWMPDDDEVENALQDIDIIWN